MTRLSHQEKIHNILEEWRLPLYFSKPSMNHLVSMIDGMLSFGFTGKISQIHALSFCKKHRTTLSYFLNKGAWDETYLNQITKQKTAQTIHKNARKQKEPVFLLFDDTIGQKTKPSSQAQSPIESCQYHFCHKEGKPVYGHQVVGMMMQSGDLAYPYDFALYNQSKEKSKIQMAVDMIDSYVKRTVSTYILCDSWYTSKRIIEAGLGKGIHTIGALRSNRIFFQRRAKTNQTVCSRYFNGRNRPCDRW
ncbi:transposase [Bacillus carboniphilus]|uniref:Transposase n=1 Tax=Bacillus carboniphilus TaxID=86663 RepID=A0ABY9JRP4_9BACI|nr:transposase [Bacillus carboniphilus]WLR41408.1 transposase [Bacillus carboniphilus]